MKKQSSHVLMIFSIFILLLISADLPSPLLDTTDFKFDVGSEYGDRDKFLVPTFNEDGCILAQVKPWPWLRSGTTGIPASELALVINGTDQTGYYARSDGKATSNAPLWVSYIVPSAKVTSKVTWTISVVNFSRSGTAKGSIRVDYPPTQMPCEFKAAASKTRGTIDISWRYLGKPFRGFFIVERSTNNQDWNTVVSGCRMTAPTTTSATTPVEYSCADTNLTSNSLYYYRACTIISTATPAVLNCTRANYITPAVSMRIP